MSAPAKKRRPRIRKCMTILRYAVTGEGRQRRAEVVTCPNPTAPGSRWCHKCRGTHPPNEQLKLPGTVTA